MPSKALVTPDLTESHAFEKNVLMLSSTEPTELASPLSVETMNSWMPPRMPDTVVEMVCQMVPQSMLMMPSTTPMTAWMTAMAALMTGATVWMTARTA